MSIYLKRTQSLILTHRGTNHPPLTHETMFKRNSHEPLSRQLNRNVYIKVYGNNYNQLVGVPMLLDLVGDVLFEKILDKILNSTMDKLTIKLRRGLKITIYAK